MAAAAPSSCWPWDKLGSFKYLLYAPIAARVAYSRPWEGGLAAHPADLWLLHILVLTSIRLLVYTVCCSISNMLWLTRNRKIVKGGVDFKQIDLEWHWDNFAILDAFVAAAASPLVSRVPLPVWNWSGLVQALLVHVFVSEPLFYWVHREVHRSDTKLYARFHSAHHASPVPAVPTAAFGSPVERLFLCAVMALPLVGAALAGTMSLVLVYVYVLAFDLLRCLAHCNVEVVPHRFFQAVPALRYVVSTPTYHALHHKDKNSNFCLFVPFFDYLGGTVHHDSWDRHREVSSVKNSQVPGFVFLAHVVDMAASMHAPFVYRGFSALPYSTKLFMIPIWPVALVSMPLMWLYSKVFLVSFYNLRGRLHQTWAVPRFGFQYFLPFAKDGINDRIEEAILRADRIGVKVISLAALNKNEALNGGGTLFVKKHPDLRVRVVHGNTLTAAVILHGLPADAEEVFLTGATSKLGRAIALYLCRKKVRVLMMTMSTERFLRIKKEAPAEFQQYLVQVTKYQAAQHCKTWVVGKWLSPSEQGWAPAGTHFHQFVVPPMIGFRRDCTYGTLAAMRLPEDVEGLGTCEYTLERGVVHACHAGGVVHFLEGYQHHEVGAIDVDRIDVVWEAALRHGLRPA